MTSWPPAPQQDEQPAAAPEESVTGWRGFLRWLFTAPPGQRSAWSIIGWWEVRRLSYNLIVGVLGFCSLLLFFLFMSVPGMLKPGEDAVEPMALLLVPFGVNICYTAGWIIELLCKWACGGVTGSTGPALLKAGIGFSLFVIAVPMVLACIACLGHLFGRH